MDYAELTRRGVAVGESDIREDSITFRFGKKGEHSVTFPTAAVAHGLAQFNGYFYEASIEEVKKLAAKLRSQAKPGGADG